MDKRKTREGASLMWAHADGVEIQVDDSYLTCEEGWTDDEDPVWDFDSNLYRRKPKATIRPWTMEECPVGEVVQRKPNGAKHVIVAAYSNCAVLGVSSETCDRNTTYNRLREDYAMLNGDPCGVREEGDS